MVALAFEGYRSHIGPSRTAAPSRSVAPAGPLLDLSGPDVRSARPPAKTVALTFDDGPDPQWTPKILDLLRRRHVPATFFVVGARVLDHPALLRAEVAGGNEIGSHTFVNGDLGDWWHRNLELSR